LENDNGAKDEKNYFFSTFCAISRLPLTMQGVQKRALPRIGVLIVMTENYAIFCLPRHGDKFDYAGFTGSDPKFYKWCQDLFLYYWSKAKRAIAK